MTAPEGTDPPTTAGPEHPPAVAALVAADPSDSNQGVVSSFPAEGSVPSLPTVNGDSIEPEPEHQLSWPRLPGVQVDTAGALTNARALRVARGLPMDRIAVLANMSLNSLRLIECSTDVPTLDRLPLGFYRRLASVLGVRLGELYGLLS